MQLICSFINKSSYSVFRKVTSCTLSFVDLLNLMILKLLLSSMRTPLALCFIELANHVSFDIIQFHGDETPEQCRQLANLVNKRWIKALRVNTKQDALESVNMQIDSFAAAGASSILLDAYHQHKYGGTGARFDWSLIPNDSSLPIILAGGLDADNVAATIELPIYAVDVSGGIEIDKGKKDPAKMRAFMKAVKRDRWQNETLSEPSNINS